MIYSHVSYNIKIGEKDNLRFAVVAAVVLGHGEHKRQAAKLQEVAMVEQCGSLPSGDRHWISASTLADGFLDSCHSGGKKKKVLKPRMSHETAQDLRDVAFVLLDSLANLLLSVEHVLDFRLDRHSLVFEWTRRCVGNIFGMLREVTTVHLSVDFRSEL